MLAVIMYHQLRGDILKNGVEFIINSAYAPNDADGSFGAKCAERARAFHESIPGYMPTPLVRLDSMAERFGVENIFVKDESKRFGLNSFKALGGSYAIASWIGQRMGLDGDKLSFDLLTSCADQLTFVTATDGNHGRGVAWTAQLLGCKSVVYMPKGTTEERLEHIRRLGADASITEYNYDDAVRHASRVADENGWLLVQDTAWDGYEAIPRSIMEGYTTMAAEIYEQLGGVVPTHIFLQAGVGAMAGAVAGFFSSVYASLQDKPRIVIVEPKNAACLFKTAAAADGKVHAVGGDLATIMAGLSCGEPCTIGWDVLRDNAYAFASIPDSAAETAMRALAFPTGEDPAVVSGESGAAALGFFMCIMSEPDYGHIRTQLGITPSSRLLFISTEGDTDKESYQRIIGSRA